MLNKARRKFTIWATIAMVTLVVILVGAFNIVNWQQTDKRLDDALIEIAKYNSPDSADFMMGKNPPRYIDMGDSRNSEADYGSSGNEIPTGDSLENESGIKEDLQQPTSADEDNTSPAEPIRPFIPEIPRGRTSAVVQYASRYTTIVLDKYGKLKDIVQNQKIFSEEEAEILREETSARGEKNGYYQDFKYVYSTGFEDDILIHVLDCSTDLNAVKSLLITSVLVALVGLIVAFLFILKMSGQAVKPVKISIEKQKQFITNAGHELKTPLSAIATNMDILSMDLGPNEWVDGTRRQVFRLRKLVGNLVSLSKMEEENTMLEMMVFSVSELAGDCADDFESIAEMNGKELVKHITPDLKMTGDASTIHQLMAILLDNAIKYSLENAQIEFSISSEGKNVCIQTVNSWENLVSKEDLEKLFERFYRGDTSRNNDGNSKGYGLGLSIAKAIVEKNHGKINISLDNQRRIVFKVCFKVA